MRTKKNEGMRPEASLPDATAEMAKYGIVCVPVDHFHYREFRYTNLKDAVAQAKRDRREA